ncbi:MAG: aspartate 1-decarboxylase [Candidatus Omnitrophota bacterium]
MLRSMCKAKIHAATVTEANLNYVGSITIDKKLLDAVDILAFERVQIVNLNNGSRVETYVMEGKSGSGIICMNGAAARWAHKGDKVIIISYGIMDTKEARRCKPRIVFCDQKNRIAKGKNL